MEKYSLEETELYLYKEMLGKTKYFNSLTSKDLQFRIIDLFSYMNNQRMTISEIANGLEESNTEIVKAEVKKLNENGTLVHFNSTHNIANTISEALDNSEYKVDKKALEVHRQFIKSAKSIEKVKGTLNGNKIVEFYNLFNKLLTILKKSYNDEIIDIKELITYDGTSILQKLFSDGSGYYDSINNELENFEDSIRQLNDAISIADDETCMLNLVDDYSTIIKNVIDFIEDLNRRVRKYIFKIADLFDELKEIHENKDVKELKRFYQPIVDSDDTTFLTLNKEESIRFVVNQFNMLIQQENGRGNVFKSFIKRMGNQTNLLINIRNDILNLKKSMESQAYFRNIANDFFADKSKDINLEIDKYFSTSFIEHFSVKDDYVKIGKESDSLIYELNHKKKIEYTTREKSNTKYTEEELLEIEEQQKTKEEKLEKRINMIDKLFPNNVFVNRLLNDEEFEFMKDLYFKSIYGFNKVDNKEESFYVDKESNNTKFKIILKENEDDFIIRTNKKSIIFNNTEMEVFKL